MNLLPLYAGAFYMKSFLCIRMMNVYIQNLYLPTRCDLKAHGYKHFYFELLNFYLFILYNLTN